MAAPMPDWFEGPGMYRALEINSGELALGGAEIDPIPPNCEFIVIGHNQTNWRVVSRLLLVIGFRLIIRAEKIETKSYYDFIVDDGSSFLGMPRGAEFIPFDMIAREWLCNLICNTPPPDVDPHDMVKIGAALMWIRDCQNSGRWWQVVDSVMAKQCKRDVELATSHTLKMKALKALRDARGTYDLDAVRSTLPAMLHPDFDKYVASKAHMKSAR
jgi:hypothetical protein